LSSKIILEVFSSAFCNRCIKAKREIKALVDAADDKKIEYREVDVVDQLDYSVSLGVLNTPSIAINGKLVFTSMPTLEELRKVLNEEIV